MIDYRIALTPLSFGSLFAGIGGFDLGFERAGLICRWQVENDPNCIRVLEKHWPDVRRYGDIRSVDWSLIDPVDVLCGGFPCQPVSIAGKRLGEDDERWMWPEFYRAICAIRPRYVVVENVPGLLDKGFGSILRDLAASEYDAEWQVLPAYAVGAPQTRKRVFVVAYPSGERCDSLQVFNRADYQAFLTSKPEGQWGITLRHGLSGRVFITPNAGAYRVVDGLSDGLDRLHMLGNAIVPQVAELVGFLLMRYHAAFLSR